MLTADDAQLVQRDNELPGLAWLLDCDQLGDVLRSGTDGPSNLSEISAHYLRYKPRTNCLATFASPVYGRLHAIAYRPQATDKLDKAEQHLARLQAASPDTLFPGFVDRQRQLALFPFPLDTRLTALASLDQLCHSPTGGPEWLQALIPGDLRRPDAAFSVLSYKPQRRCVLRYGTDDTPLATVRIYTSADYQAAKRAAKQLMANKQWCHAELLGHSDRHHVTALRWFPGSPLSITQLGDYRCDVLPQLVELLRTIHAHPHKKMPILSPQMVVRRLANAVAMLEWLIPERAACLSKLAAYITQTLLAATPDITLVHGDFHPGQILARHESLGIIDWDSAANGPRGVDLGNFVAHLFLDAVAAQHMPSADSNDTKQVRDLVAALLDHYEGAESPSPTTAAHIGCALLHVATAPFRTRHPRWSAACQALVDLAESFATNTRCQLHQGRQAPAQRTSHSVPVDHSSLLQNSKPEWLTAALDPQIVADQVVPVLNAQWDASLSLSKITVRRFKPDRRALVQYDFATYLAAQPCISVLAKCHWRQADIYSFAIQSWLYATQPSDNSAGFRIARTLGIVPEAHLWLQEMLPGSPAETWTTPTSDAYVSQRAGHCLRHFHGMTLPLSRTHTHEAEARILGDAFERLADDQPAWKLRLATLWQQCRDLLESLPDTSTSCLHRDFYPDQVLVHDQNLSLVDMDLAAWGDPLVDVGNYVAHLREKALRVYHQPYALTHHEEAFLAGYFANQTQYSAAAVKAMTLVSLARHVAISMRIPARRPFAERILTYCEAELKSLPVADSKLMVDRIRCEVSTNTYYVDQETQH